MYNKEFWDKVYEQHFDDAPWMYDSWKDDVLGIIKKHIPVNAESLLDYGCGNGFMGNYFYSRGFQVDLSDISETLICKLKDKFKDTEMGIIETSTPHELSGRKYDVIIAWDLFHHINPRDWRGFLEGFEHLMNKNGVLIIGGFDEDDIVINEDEGKARYTKHEAWCLNSMIDYFDYERFRLVKNDTVSIAVPPFLHERAIRYYILEKYIDKIN